MKSKIEDKSYFVGIPQFSNPLWVAMETMHFHIANNMCLFRTTSFRIQGGGGGPNEQFGTHEKLSWRMQGNLNWMPG